MLRWFLILWQCFWLVLFLPGHTRGVITMPDGRQAGRQVGSPEARTVSSQSQPRLAAKSCCAESSRPINDRGDRKPTEEEKRRCVVCYIAKGYTVASAFSFQFDFAERTLEDCFEAESLCIVSPLDFPYYAIGPPV
jgi:hypothetical protein